jgi:2-polyprenyl-3-methyl-5-hydroxy-6-metoxy-1,4-benzoquinol methylase
MLLRRIAGAIRQALADLYCPHDASGRYDRFESLYARGADPWGARVSESARRKYEALERLLPERSAAGSILDVGCGEGLFTARLVARARRVVGVDASLAAVLRARRQVPGAAFVNATLESLEISRPFDCVTAIEMLYYVPAPEAAVEKLRRLGGTLLLSYTARDRARLDPIVDRVLPGNRKAVNPPPSGGDAPFVAVLYP